MACGFTHNSVFRCWLCITSNVSVFNGALLCWHHTVTWCSRLPVVWTFNNVLPFPLLQVLLFTQPANIAACVTGLVFVAFGEDCFTFWLWALDLGRWGKVITWGSRWHLGHLIRILWTLCTTLLFTCLLHARDRLCTLQLYGCIVFGFSSKCLGSVRARDQSRDFQGGGWARPVLPC